MRDATLDLLLGSCCTVCAAPGRLLCARCDAALPRVACPCPPTPCPAGLVVPTAVGEYAGALKALVNAHKEHHQLALARPLGDLLARSVSAHLAGRGEAPVLLVPVPSRRGVVRTRGHDPLVRVARRAAAVLRGGGTRAGVAPLLLGARGVADQAGLGAADRGRNLQGAFTPREPAVRRACRPLPGGGPLVVLVDDVVTTGATLREAQRALEAAGVRVSGTAVVAATRRRSEPVRM